MKYSNELKRAEREIELSEALRRLTNLGLIEVVESSGAPATYCIAGATLSPENDSQQPLPF